MNKKKTIAIICGGYSGEHAVSLRSAQGIYSWIDRNIFDPYIVVIDREGWRVQLSESEFLPIDRAFFGFVRGSEIRRFDYAYVTIHGTPGENGILQGYLDMLHIPYNTGGVLTEALTFSKYVCNRYLSTFPEIRVAPSIRLKRGEVIPSPDEIAQQIGLPLFIKPNTGGSSVATSRVAEIEGIASALLLAFEESDEVLIERFISGTEVTCGCYEAEGAEITALPITEVVTQNEFFDYDAKYNGQVEEITPARIPQDTYTHIQSLTQAIYRYTDASGVIRVDYIIEEDGLPTLLEVNTTPGMTPTSFIPQQVTASGRNMTDFLTEIILPKLR